jgi:hypothetical protein
LYGFSGPVSTQKTGLALAFSFYSSNRNSGKAFAGLSKKKKNLVAKWRKYSENTTQMLQLRAPPINYLSTEIEMYT